MRLPSESASGGYSPHRHGTDWRSPRGSRRLVEELSLLARLDQRRPLDREPVDLAEIASAAVDAARVAQPDPMIDLEAPASLVALADGLRIRRIVDNLLANAERHTPPAAAVYVRVRTEGHDAVLEVEDEGPGIRRKTPVASSNGSPRGPLQVPRKRRVRSRAVDRRGARGGARRVGFLRPCSWRRRAVRGADPSGRRLGEHARWRCSEINRAEHPGVDTLLTVSDQPDLLRRHVEAFNKGVRSGDFGPMIDGFTDEAVLVFEGAPVGPFIGRSAIAEAYRSQPPDDEIDILRVSEADATIEALYGWHRDLGLPAGRMIISPSGELISRLVVTFEPT